jgi:hypothetical protein
MHLIHLTPSNFHRKLSILSRSTADEEPLVDGSVNLLRGEVLVGRQRRQRLGGHAAGGVLDSHVGANGRNKSVNLLTRRDIQR